MAKIQTARKREEKKTEELTKLGEQMDTLVAKNKAMEDQEVDRLEVVAVAFKEEMENTSLLELSSRLKT